MIEYVTKTNVGTAAIKANRGDTTLCRLLEIAGFEKQRSANKFVA